MTPVADICARVLAAPRRLPGTQLMTIDGPAGAGKTTLAESLAIGLRAAGVTAEVVHLDDLYDGWTGLDDELTDHLELWVVAALRRGQRVCHPVYDWQAGEFGAWREVPRCDVLILEGVGAGQPVAAAVAAVQVWVEAPAEVCRVRGVARGGVAVEREWDGWVIRETEHFRRYGTRGRADVIVNGA